MRKQTEKKIRNACNKLVYLWRRDYGKSLKKNTPIPKAITIPKIAKEAGITSKTIYTNEEYKSIALANIAKTTPEIDEALGVVLVNKDNYNYNEVKDIVTNLNLQHREEIEALLNEIVKQTKMVEKLKTESSEMEDIIREQAFAVAELEKEKQDLKGRLELLSKNT